MGFVRLTKSCVYDLDDPGVMVHDVASEPLAIWALW
jgi:hypothetical protein